MDKLGGKFRLRELDVLFYAPNVTALVTGTTATGGAETQVLRVAAALRRAGVKVGLAVLPPSDGAAVPGFYEGLRVFVRSASRAHERLLGKIWEFDAMSRCCGASDAAAVVIRTGGAHVGVVGLAARLRRRRFVFSCASLMDFDFGLVAPRLRDRLLYRLGVWLANVVVVQTEEQASLCRRVFGREPVLIESLAESAEPALGPAEAFVWIGRFDENKQPLAFVELARLVPEARFRMVGVPHDRELSEEVVRVAESVPNLEVLAPMPRAELLGLFDSAVAVVSTSKLEGMPNVFLEGWARGVPALALGHDPDRVIERLGLGSVAGGSVERLAEAVRELWRGETDRAALGERCRGYVAAHHSEATVVQKWRSVLHLESSLRIETPVREAAAC